MKRSHCRVARNSVRNAERTLLDTVDLRKGHLFALGLSSCTDPRWFESLTMWTPWHVEQDHVDLVNCSNYVRERINSKEWNRFLVSTRDNLATHHFNNLFGREAGRTQWKTELLTSQAIFVIHSWSNLPLNPRWSVLAGHQTSPLEHFSTACHKPNRLLNIYKRQLKLVLNYAFQSRIKLSPYGSQSGRLIHWTNTSK